MNELVKTILFCLAAVILVVAATVVDPGAATPEIFNDQGELFYPAFTDAQLPKAIEVIEYDEATATARPLKVEFKDKMWRIPSHFSYPADAEKRLAGTAAALMELRKDSVVSDRVEDHAQYGVIDPLDAKATGLTGRGERVTLRDGEGAVLTDFVVGKPVEGKAGYHYMRVPGQRRTYAVKTDAEISARFEDWIETDLLKLAADDVRKIVIHGYSINETFGVLENIEDVVLTRSNDKWSAGAARPPSKQKVDELLGALDNLRIVDVQPKPKGLSEDLKTFQGIRLSSEAVLSLRQKGFFLTPSGQLFSNEGEILVETANGLLYTLRFGEIASGGAGISGEPGKSGGEGETAAKTDDNPQEASKGEGERRYLFITVSYSQERASRYAEGGKGSGEKGKELEGELRSRFADWYYIISGADFAKLRPQKKQILS